MAPTVFEGIDELRGAVGAELGATDWLVVDQDRIDTFAEATGDHQWIHVDPERAAKGPFGSTIAHGYLTLALTNLFLPQLLEVRDVSMGVNYGVDKVRFPAPCRWARRCGARRPSPTWPRWPAACRPPSASPSRSRGRIAPPASSTRSRGSSSSSRRPSFLTGRQV